MSRETLAQALLAEAERVLASELAERLEGKDRYAVKMIARALSVARRDLKDGAALDRETQSALSQLLDAEGESAELEARFVTALRDGRFDADQEAHEALMQIARARVAISNPAALKG